MKKSLKKSTVATQAMLTTAALLAIHALPGSLYGQVLKTEKTAKVIDAQQANSRSADYFLKIKVSDQQTSIVGMLNGTPVYKNERGEYFTINTKTGDLIFVSNEDFTKYACCVYIKIGDIKGERASDKSSQKKSLTNIKFGGDDIRDVQIIGVDKDGHTIHRNSRNETFYVDPVSGDLIYVKL